MAKKQNDPLAAGLKMLQNQGLLLDVVIADGDKHRCATTDRPHKKNGEYRAFDAKGVLVVCWHNWRTNDGGKWLSSKKNDVSSKQKKAVTSRLKKIKEEDDKRQAAAAERAQVLYKKARNHDSHDYLDTKGIGMVQGLKVDGSHNLIIPAYSKDGALTSLQRIDKDGNKRFLPGGKLAGSFFRIGKLDGAGIVLVCEGIATGISLYLSTGYPVLAAFFAGNLKNVAKVATELAPEAKIIVCADNDIKSGGKPNPGVVFASAAALEADAFIAVPVMKKNGVAVACDFNDLHQAVGEDEVQRQVSLASRPDYYYLTKDELPYDFTFCAAGKRPGIYYQPKKEDVKPIWVGPPMEVRAQVRDKEGDGWSLELGWTDLDGRTHIWVMPKSLLTSYDTTTWFSPLIDGGYGAPLNPDATKLLKVFLSQYNTDRRVRSVPRTGWNDGIYVLPDATFGGSGAERIVLKAPLAKNPFQTAGTLESWQETIGAWAIGNSRIQCAICAALAAPLLSLVSQESVGMHYYGGSSTGKTTALCVASSAWGKGSTNDGFGYSWRATTNGLEGVAALHCDTLLCLDEIGEASAKTAGEAVYMLANGIGKIRSTRKGTMKEPVNWRVMFLSTGEVGLAEHMADDGGKIRAGQTVRMIDIPADAGAGYGLFEELHGFSSAQELAVAFKEQAVKHHGHLAREFLALLQPRKDKIEEILRKPLSTGFKKLCGPDADGQVRRVADYFQIFAHAGEIAVCWGLLPWEKGDASRAARSCFRAWLEHRGGTGAAEDDAIMRQVMHFIELHGASRFQRIDDADSKCINRVGFRRYNMTRQQTEYMIMPESFKTEVCKGLDVQRACELLHSRGLLLRGDGGYTRKTPSNVHGFGRPRCYTLVIKGEQDD